jgi:hypothetical protein
MKLQTLTFSASSTENDLEQDSTSSFSCALINCSLVRRSLLTYINVGEDISLLFGIDMAGDKDNGHLLHSNGDISHYFIDKEQKSCLHTDED